ncbi:MAG TPA: diguanylate cyclase [Candidatus Competibacteraceae bacterium]|nr:diguanylate cyclase [Candidatus Competibacteraceae bacterium]
MDKQAKILIIDDSPADIHILGSILGKDYQLFFATNGADGIDIVMRERLDLILLDVLMPDMDGYAICDRLKGDQLLRNIPVIFVTGLNEVNEEARGLEAGAVDYLTKPISAPIVKARVRTHLELKRHQDLLHQLACLDGLTCIANRRRFDELLEQEWRRSLRIGQPLSLIMIDVDDFKAYNDHYGHLAGDECLRLVASTLAAAIKRPMDLLARYGGEEFACLLPETNLAGAIVVAQRLVAVVAERQIPHADSGVAAWVTISAGVASLVPSQEQSAIELVGMADTCLYRAKKEGRNRIAF